MAMRKFLGLDEIKGYLDVRPKADSAKMKVTPEQAKFLLNNCNRINRKIKSQHVETLKRDMENGSWYSDIDYIGFNKKGVLINGQHRLKALSEANVESVMLKFDFDVEQHVSMDTGSARTYSDQVAILKRMEVSIMPNKFKSVISAGIKLTQPNLNLSNTELAQIWKRYMSKLNECEKEGLFNLGNKSGASTVKSSLLWAYLSGVPMATLSQVAKVLRTGITENETDIPVIRLRDALVDLRGSSRELDTRRAQYTQQCIFNVLQGSTTNRLPSNPVMHYQGFDILEGIVSMPGEELEE
jgi:hypothetical protein